MSNKLHSVFYIYRGFEIVYLKESNENLGCKLIPINKGKEGDSIILADVDVRNFQSVEDAKAFLSRQATVVIDSLFTAQAMFS